MSDEKVEMSLDGFLEAIKALKRDVPSIDTEEYWREVNAIAAKEEKAFTEERKRLTDYKDFNRHFTM